ncbi:MAG: type II toxin-antitoxin system RelE/ParE family toxin [Nitrospirales bacterium]|nr:type II toxin-antitoxin system RelE/ParE family toxin [Nitrospirales bacterium]
MKIKILSSALDDLHKGRLFYERQGEGVGEYFFDTVFADIDSLALYAGIHLQTFGYHRMLAKRFPFAIYYKMENLQKVTVYRVLDLRQHPRKTQHALT